MIKEKVQLLLQTPTFQTELQQTLHSQMWRRKKLFYDMYHCLFLCIIQSVGIPAREMGRYIGLCQSTARRYRETLVYGAQRHGLGMKV